VRSIPLALLLLSSFVSAAIATEPASPVKSAEPAQTGQPGKNQASTLADARHGFQTKISQAGTGSPPLPHPPEQYFVRIDYKSTGNLGLPAFITPDPKDGQKRPAIIWLTGGDTNSLDDFWTPGPESNDQSASEFRKAGIVMMFPTLRGGNQNPGGKEFFYGEVDDVLAAANHLAGRPYVDPNRIYLGGHSTGGTLALLVAETGAKFKSVFAFGPVASLDRYPRALIPVDFKQHDKLELNIRSPIHWLQGIASRTYLIEGGLPPSNLGDLAELCQASRNPVVDCITGYESNHFSILAKASRVIAAKIAALPPNQEFNLGAVEYIKMGFVLKPRKPAKP